VSRDGVMTLSWTLDKVGVLAHTAVDCGLVLEAVASRYRKHEGGIKKVRVAYAGGDVDEAAPRTRRAFAAAIAEFARVAPRRMRASLPTDLPYGTALELVILAEAASVFTEQLEDPAFTLVDAQQLAELRSGLEIPARDYLR